MDLISVIVPVYKVEKYLDKCVQSIVNQTYKNLEIILVDDGSPDNCGTMCDAWAEKDSRIKVIHKENGGLSDARNAGMAAATGTYIGFVDSDDWLDVCMYEALHKAITATGSDIAACGARRVWIEENQTKELRAVNKDRILEQEAAMEALITSNGLVQTVWNKLYRKNVIENIQFAVGLIHEDEFWTWQAVACAKRIVTLKETYYNYLQRDNSIMGAGFTEKSLLVVKAKIERQSYIEAFMPELIDTGCTDLTYTCMHLGVQVLRTMRGEKTVHYLKYLKNTIRHYPISRKYLCTLTRKKKLHLRMIRLFFVPVCLIHSL